MLDRHGKGRLRFRKTGYRTHYFKSDYPSREFWDEYERCRADKAEPRTVGGDRIAPGTVHDLVTRYCAVPARLGPSETTQRKVRAIIENDFRFFVTPSGAVVGNKLVAECDFEALDTIIAAKAKDAPWQAKKLRAHLKRLFAFAVKSKMIGHNPVEQTERVKPAPTKGYHSWTEAEIDQFIARHPVGTKAYLAMMLMLWTFQRRGDAIRMKPSDIRDGRITVEQGKSGGETVLRIPVAPALVEAITATERPANAGDDTPFLLTHFGKPFSPKGFGNWFRDRCDEARLPQCSAHGLRKAASRRAAQLHMPNQTIKAMTGHKRDEEVALYTRAVEQERLADEAMAALTAWDSANRVRVAK